MNNRTIIMIAMVAVVMMMGTASAGVADAVVITDPATAVANVTDYINISFGTTNATFGNWTINVTNPLATDGTQLEYDWINLTINATSAAARGVLVNNSTIADTGHNFSSANDTIYIHLNTTIATDPNTFNVTIKNMDNTTETATLTGLKFVAGHVVSANSEIVNEPVSKVANDTDKMSMWLAMRDKYSNPVLSLASGPTITAANLNVTGSGTVSDQSSINQTTGNVTFNVTATKAGVYNVSAVCAGVTISNEMTVFVAGPAYKLAWYGDASSEPGGNSIVMDVAIQDANGNNVTWDTLAVEAPYRLTASTIAGHATIASTNPLTVDETNATSVAPLGTNYTSTFELINFTINNTYDETTTIKVQANRTLLSSETSLTYYGEVDHLEVTTDKSSMYANDRDSMLVTVQLKDASGANVDSDGVTITIGADNPTLFGGLGVIGDDATPIGSTIGANNTINGVATFTVNSTTLSGSEEIDASTDAGKTGSSSTITLMPAPEIVTNCDVVNTTATIKAGSASVITATIKDYNDEVMSGWAVTFNITSGDGTFVGESSPYTTNTDSNGNATVSVTSTNISTTIEVNVTLVDENSVTQQLGGALQSFTVDPAAITQLVIDPVSKGLTNVNGTNAAFNVTTTDAHGNLNTTALNLNVTNSNQVLGNLSLYGSATHVNNNLSLTTSGGYVRFNFTVNSTVAASATLDVTANTLYNAGKIATNLSKTVLVTTSGPTGVVVSFNKTAPVVSEVVAAYAQLTDASGNALGIAGKNMTFTVKKGSATVAIGEETTNASGIAVYNMTVSELGTYIVTASNSTLGISNSSSITFAGSMVSIVATANVTTTPVNTVVTINATAMDSAGNVATGETGDVWFTVDGANIGADTDGGVGSGSVAFVNGVATITYTEATAGTYTVLAWYNETISDTVDVTFTEDTTSSLIVTAAPTSVTANTSTDVVFTVTSEGTAVSGTAVDGATVTLSGAGVSESGTTTADGTVTIAVNATSAGTITVTASKTGYADGTTTVTVSGSGYDSADTNQDCVVSLTELMTQIGKWKTGTVGLTELMTSIGRWKLGSGGYC